MDYSWDDVEIRDRATRPRVDDGSVDFRPLVQVVIKLVNGDGFKTKGHFVFNNDGALIVRRRVVKDGPFELVCEVASGQWISYTRLPIEER